MIKSFYGFLNSKKIEKSLIKFKKISIKKVTEIMIRDFTKSNAQYEVLKINNHELLVEVINGKKKTLIIFHKVLAVTLCDYERFSHLVEERACNKGVYITTGVFQEDVYHKTYMDNFNRHIKVLDGKQFIIKQKWIRKKNNNHITYDRISFKDFF
ncbi:hypothetical protein [Clostridium sp.]|uniref:hypothetical protein n=1 Tax=Clostridium sp. TaxID=1506 RepID=UPI002602E6A4|nr:hypothetical protein [Clostridium sp.]